MSNYLHFTYFYLDNRKGIKDKKKMKVNRGYRCKRSETATMLFDTLRCVSKFLRTITALTILPSPRSRTVWQLQKGDRNSPVSSPAIHDPGFASFSWRNFEVRRDVVQDYFLCKTKVCFPADGPSRLQRVSFELYNL